MTTNQDQDSGRLAAAREKVSETAHAALDTASETLASARDAAGDTLSTAAQKAGDIYSSARESVGSAGRTAAQGVEANPLAALAGGIAAGLIAGALLPRTQKEAQLLGPLGARLSDAAREAVSAAKEAGFASFDEAGFNREAIQAQVEKLLDGASKAAGAAGGAALQAVKKPA
ncbi:hypothetical protein [Sphingomonas jatrophae]|uniref:Membrane-anchored ribosome-binding protein, inhibits growth in stationary phase, ElaB/YqjD/DUF883 family n=1 Tax=Sphingomonas jatrophae TaxID=1166337 RepID=A0A1I6JMS0_9SPHN|nr:hypothetical protein [Sphingomonas jatrophae]SFR80191.1 hypothetical protein SAMN05192580_0538 [Sphingomonas jatrophae]